MFLVTVFVMMNLKCVNSESETTLPQEIHQNKEESGEQPPTALLPKELAGLAEQLPLLYELTLQTLKLLGGLQEEGGLELGQLYEELLEGAEEPGWYLNPQGGGYGLPKELLLTLAEEGAQPSLLRGELPLLYEELLLLKLQLELLERGTGEGGVSLNPREYSLLGFPPVPRYEGVPRLGLPGLLGSLEPTKLLLTQLELFGLLTPELETLLPRFGLDFKKDRLQPATSDDYNDTPLLLGGKLGLLYRLLFALFTTLEGQPKLGLPRFFDLARFDLPETLPEKLGGLQLRMLLYGKYGLNNLKLRLLTVRGLLKEIAGNPYLLQLLKNGLKNTSDDYNSKYSKNTPWNYLNPNPNGGPLNGGKNGGPLNGKNTVLWNNRYLLGNNRSRSLLENESESKLEDINDEKTTQKASNRDI